MTEDLQPELKTTRIDEIERNGCTPAGMGTQSHRIVCADGFSMSVVANEYAYCSPREDEGPFDTVEVGYPSARPEPWDQWRSWCESPDHPTSTVYGYVPIEAVHALVLLHGGEA